MLAAIGGYLRRKPTPEIVFCFFLHQDSRDSSISSLSLSILRKIIGIVFRIESCVSLNLSRLILTLTMIRSVGVLKVTMVLRKERDRDRRRARGGGQRPFRASPVILVAASYGPPLPG